MKQLPNILLLCALTFSLGAQDKTVQAFKGYPSPDGKIDIRSGFLNTPEGYGNVPFFWWTGDSLKLDRLAYELDLLADSPTDGFAVSYNHTHAKVDIEANANGHGPCGVADYGSPKVFSEEWWKIWNEFSGMCADKGMGAGFDDYVLAWPGNHDFMDDVINDSSFKGYQGKMECLVIAEGETLPENVLSVSPSGNDSLMVIHTVSSPDLHPDFGKKFIDRYFEPFVDHMDERGLQGMNYFFQDELTYYPSIHSWCEDMPEQFYKRKGYDIVPHLPALFTDLGEETVRTRLDYAEVVSDLAEERFFKPVFEWHSSRGLIYGCDNNGRGLNPVEYMDYFRETSWFTAPGNDAPARGSSFTQTKVSSSIAHLYGRPRTWLEAFHSMGWDANGAVLTHQLDHHIIAGGNLLCMHGLYYSTHGGWWEWAPPSFHFRMPYWPHMKKWLRYAQRLCFVLSQGRHVCDVAILYPTETMQAFPGTGFKLCAEVSESLSVAGIDFDFIDFRSLQKAGTENGELSVSGEKYKVLILPGAKAMHEETAQAVDAFEKAGGLVLRIDEDPAQARDYVKSHILRDFVTQSGYGRVLHRRIADNDVYMVMDVAKGDSLFFRSHGKLEKWDAMNGSIGEIPVLRVDDNGTWVRFDGETGNSALYVFSAGNPIFADDENVVEQQAYDVLNLDGEWKACVIPTMDNRWGDFRLPASNEKIGVEARSMKCTLDGKDFGESVYGYGPYMMSSTDGVSWTPYLWSWQYGVYDSPGSQGYHGLKGKVDCRFLILDKGGDQYFKTDVYSPANASYRILKEGTDPTEIRIDGKNVRKDVVKLKEGWHELWLKYENTTRTDYELSRLYCYTVDERQRSMVMLIPEGEPDPQDVDLYDKIVSSRWYESKCLKFNAYHGNEWSFSFETAPGTETMQTKVNGEVKRILIDGREVPFVQNGAELYVRLANVNPRVSSAEIIAETDYFSPGASFFAEPVKIQCSGGVMPLGDWTDQGAMKYFSGGVKYSRDFIVESSEGDWVLDLGEVDATCEVWINGNKADELLNKPYSVEISNWLEPGRNTLDVIVYSSLANHYQTIPTPYRGRAHAGLCGPVLLRNYR